MLDYAELYLRSRNKAEQYRAVDKHEYAFESIVAGRKKVKSALQTSFVELAFQEIDNPRSGRAYMTIRDIADNMDKIADTLERELPRLDNPPAPSDNLDDILGGGVTSSSGLADQLREPEHSNAVKSVVLETITSQKALKNERKQNDFVIEQVRKANTALQNALGNISEVSKRDGVEEQLTLIAQALDQLRAWLLST
jgi:hypothetical protein